jgi:signal transduction histidine kinase
MFWIYLDAVRERLHQIKRFARAHALWLGLLAVAVPLCLHLTLQYRALRELQETLPAARKAYMRRYLSLLSEQIKEHYEKSADATLNVPAAAFLFRYPTEMRNWRKLTEDELFTPIDPTKIYDFDLIRKHFSSHRFAGARRLFVGIAAGVAEPRYAAVYFYDQLACSFRARASKEENGAAHAAAAQWIGYLMTNTHPQSRELSVDERDPANRIIVKPIFDANERLVGVAGMILDNDYFPRLLAQEIQPSLARHFPEKAGDAIITLLDEEEKVLFSNQSYTGKPWDVGWRMPLVYTDRYLGMRMRVMEEELSQSYFSTNLAFSLMTALVLLGGLALTLRTASRAMRLSQMKADFVSNVSHELRTPLASIRVFGEFLKLGRVQDNERVREYGEYIETESRRLTQLINNILDFSKIESGQKTYHFVTADVQSVVAETLKTFEVRLEQSGFVIQYDAPAAALPEVEMDAEALAQALLNLLDNAVKYSGEARVIHVKLSRTIDFITIGVTDHGIGIAPEECGKVFEKFYRVGDCLVHDVKGSGLGLSIVKHIVEAHRGFVTVNSVAGQGSTFTIHLPTHQAIGQDNQLPYLKQETI